MNNPGCMTLRPLLWDPHDVSQGQITGIQTPVSPYCSKLILPKCQISVWRIQYYVSFSMMYATKPYLLYWLVQSCTIQYDTVLGRQVQCTVISCWYSCIAIFKISSSCHDTVLCVCENGTERSGDHWTHKVYVQYSTVDFSIVLFSK